MRDERGENFNCTRGLLPPLSGAHRKAKAITATARKLAVFIYRVLSGKLIYNASGVAAYHQLNRIRELRSLRKRAKLLGLDLLDPSTGELLTHPVS